MHEYSVVEQLIKIVNNYAEQNEVKKITKIRLIVGTITGFVEESIRFYFGIMKKNTIIENSELEIIYSKPKAFCDNCKMEFEINDYFQTKCPKCNKISNKIIKNGTEFLIESIEIEK